MSICASVGGGLHVVAVFDKSVLDESDIQCLGLFGSIGLIHDVGLC